MRLVAEIAQPLVDGGTGDDRVHGGIEPCANLVGRLGRREQADPAVQRDARETGLGQGRYVRKRLGALGAGHGERAHETLLALRKNFGHGACNDIDMAAEQRVHGRHAALERHAGRIRFGGDLEYVLGRDPRRGAAIAEGEGLAFRLGEKFRQRAGGVGGIHRERLAVDRREGDGA